jgi:hypothetical protein
MSVEQLRANAAAAERIAKERNEIIAAMAAEAARKEQELKELNAAIAQAQQVQQVQPSAGTASGPTTAPSVTSSVWTRLGAPASVASAAAAIAAPVITTPTTAVRMSSTTIEDIDPNATLLGELADEVSKKVVKVIIKDRTLYFEFNRGELNVGETLKRLGKMIGLPHGERFKPHSQENICYTQMTADVLRTLATACRKGAAAPSESSMCKAAEFFFALCSRWNNGGKLKQFDLPEGYAAVMGVNRASINSKDLVPTTKESITEVLDILSDMYSFGSFRPRSYPQQSRSTTSGGGGGGGAAVPTPGNENRSVKQSKAESTGPSFQTGGKLRELIEEHYTATVGAPRTPAAERLHEALRTNGLAFYSDGLVQAANNSMLTSEEIEKILCVVFSLQTTAEIAEAERKKKTAAYEAQQAEAAASTQIGAIPEGAESEDESDDEADDGNEAGGGSKDDDESELVTVYKLPRNVVYTLQQVCDSGKDIAGIYSKVAAEFAIVFSENEYHAENGQNLSTTTCNEIAGNVAILAIKLMYM